MVLPSDHVSMYAGQHDSRERKFAGTVSFVEERIVRIGVENGKNTCNRRKTFRWA